MAVGVSRNLFTCPRTTYAQNDVRGRQTVIRAFVDFLVGLGIGWTIVSESVPSANFTSTSTLYAIWIKFRNSDHLIQIFCYGSATTSAVSMNMFIYKAGVSAGSAGNTTNSLVGFSLAISPPSLDDDHKLWVTTLYDSNFSVSIMDAVTAVGYPAPGPTNYQYLAAKALEDFSYAGVTSEHVFVGSSSLAAIITSSGYLTGVDISLSCGSAPYSPVSTGSTVEKIQRIPIVGYSWIVKSLIAFSNEVGAQAYSVITMNSTYYMVLMATRHGSIALRLGPVS